MGLRLVVTPPSRKHKPSIWRAWRPVELVPIVGDLVIANLLAQIVYWYSPDANGNSRLQFERVGHYWIAKSREEWCQETGLTLKQYKRAISRLKQNGLVVVRQMVYKKGPIKRSISWLRLDVVRLQEALDAVGTTLIVDRKGPPLQRTQRDHRTYSESTSVSTVKRSCASTKGRSGEEERSGEDPDPEREEIPVAHQYGDDDMKAEDIVKQQKAKQVALHTSSLSLYWRKRVLQVHGEGSVKETLTFKENGQLKLLQKALGDQTRPVIDYAINYWLKFADKAGAKAGTTYPTSPHIGFLLMHYHVALVTVQSVAKKAAVVTPVAKPDIDIASIPSYTPESVAKESPHVMTDDELETMIDALKE